MVENNRLKEIDIRDGSFYYLNNLTNINDLVLESK